MRTRSVGSTAEPCCLRAPSKTKHRGIAAVAADFLLNLIAYNLIRIPKLVAA
jgi:hypothetical protein